MRSESRRPQLRVVLGLVAAVMLSTSMSARGQGIEFLGSSNGAPFSEAARVGDFLVLSGQIGARQGKLPDTMEAQAQQVMENISATLKKYDSSLDEVFKCTVMLTDMSRWDEFNKVYVSFFKRGRIPTRSAMGATALARGAQIEVECWAYHPAKK